MTVPATIELDRMASYKWIMKGAQPSDTVRAILRFKGVMYFKHLMRGVEKGALTQEEASKKFQEWIDAKEGKIATSREAEAKKQEDFLAKVSGIVPVIKAPAPVVVETPAAEAAAEEAAPVVTPTSALDAAIAEAAGETTEAVKEVVAEAAPEVEAAVEAATEVADEAADAAKDA
jgi:small subunit ribosomal protein S16